MNRICKAVVVLATTSVIASSVSACNGKHDSNSMQNVACVDVSSQLTGAQQTLTADQAKVKDSKGTPDENKADTAVKRDQQNIADLNQRQASPDCNTSDSSSATSVAGQCNSTWKMISTTPANENWVSEGVTEIQNAKTSADALKAGMAWLNAIKAYPGEINGASLYLLSKPVDTSSLVKNGCATQVAVNEVQVLKTYMELHPPKVDQAPADAVNTGTSNGAVVANASAGISGNRKAISVVGANGKTVYIMARCGNAVTVGPPPVPTTPPPPAVTCTPTQQGVENGCNGKQAASRPKPSGGDVVTPPAGGYIDRSGHPHSSAYVPPTNSNPSPGKTDSGRGATNTTTAPQPSATETVPKTSSAPSDVPTPPAGG